MRTDCKFYESRTYANGDTVRKCDIDMAPEAPWRCPDDCPAFQRRTDIGWNFGSLTFDGPLEPPPGLEEGGAELLDAAEEIVNAAGPDILAELQAEELRNRPWYRKLRDRFRR